LAARHCPRKYGRRSGEGVAGDDRPEAGLQGPQAVVVILEAADAKAFVQKADLVDDLAADPQTEADQSVGLLPAAVVGLAPVPGEAVQPTQVFIRDGHLLLAADAIGTGAGQTDAGNTSPKRQGGTVPRCRVGLVLQQVSACLEGADQMRLHPFQEPAHGPFRVAQALFACPVTEG
jgi:hypothetical protein